MTFRKEKKFRLTSYDSDSLKSKLLLQGMEPLYEKREVNSLYYDTNLYDMYHDSEEGLLPRRKMRIRWYDNIEKANIEVKISSLEGRFKTSNFIHVKSENTLPSTLNDHHYGMTLPSLRVSYTREYFMFEAMRVTFDSDIKYLNYRRAQNIPFKDDECVMEIKTGINVPDDYIESLVPFPVARFSKYSRGLLITNGGL